MYSNVAVTCVDNPRCDVAIRYARRSIAVAQRIEGSGGQQSLAYGILAEALRESGDLDEALQAIRSSRTIQERLADDGQTWRRANLILALWREGSILAEDDDISLHRPQEALPPLRRALDLVTDLASKDADDVIHHQMGGEVARRLGDLMRTSDPPLALAAYDQGLRLVRQAKTVNDSIRRTEATLLARSAYALRLLHRNEESWQRVDAALRLLKDTGDYPAAAIEPASEADLTVRALADHYAAVGQRSKAVEIYVQLLAKLNASKSDLKGDLRNTTYLSNAYAALARTLRSEGRIQDAARYDSERAALWQFWRQKLPENAFVQRQASSLP
jgi:tetratricopeptide (TPR) repeat protein